MRYVPENAGKVHQKKNTGCFKFCQRSPIDKNNSSEDVSIYIIEDTIMLRFNVHLHLH